MSHNPNTVKSQDDLPTTNDGKRSSDVLIEAISKAERLQKQLDIAIEGLKKYESGVAYSCTIDGVTTDSMPLAADRGQTARKYLKRIEELNK